jgi:glycolate oxidase iron-sulfur subunit
MYARPAEALVGNAHAEEARDLIRRCVHCGFCLPACPTYRVTGNELDSPRGRIYLIKELVERGAASETTRTHLDRCLTCRACEPACPSGVQYGRLVDLGRDLVQGRPPPAPRALRERLLRSALLAVATRRSLFTPLARLAQALRGLMPRAARSFVPPPPHARTVAAAREVARPVRRMVVLEGCVQPGLAPQINAAATRVLERLGIALVAAHEIGCCGAMDHHLGRVDTALDKVRRNVAAGARRLDDGVEAIVSTASGCGVFAKDYGYVLRHASPDLHRAGARVAAATRDLCEVIDVASLARLHATRGAGGARLRVAWQAPCSLQHGQHAATAGKVEAILEAVDCELVPVVNASLCCGSAGTYSLLQPELSRELRARKLASLLGPAPDVIATANVGCLEHLRQASQVPVRHWIELVDDALERGTPANAQAVATTT